MIELNEKLYKSTLFPSTYVYINDHIHLVTIVVASCLTPLIIDVLVLLVLKY